MVLLKLYLCNHSLMANLLILSSLIKHSCTFTKKSLFRVFLKTFSIVIFHEGYWPLKKELPIIGSSSPYSAVTDSEQRKKLKKPTEKNLLQMSLLTCWRLWGGHFLNQILKMFFKCILRGFFLVFSPYDLKGKIVFICFAVLSDTISIFDRHSLPHSHLTQKWLVCSSF